MLEMSHLYVILIQIALVQNDDEFSTVPYMEAGTIPPNWYKLVKYSSKMATAQDVHLLDTWLRGQSNERSSDPLSDPFAIATDNQKRQKTNISGYASSNKNITVQLLGNLLPSSQYADYKPHYRDSQNTQP